MAYFIINKPISLLLDRFKRLDNRFFLIGIYLIPSEQQQRQTFIVGIEVSWRHIQSFRELMHNVNACLMDALLIAIDSGAGDELVYARKNAEFLL